MIEIQGLETIVPDYLIQGLDSQVVMGIVGDIAQAARAEWIRQAGETLTSTRRDYINGIQPVDIEPGRAVVRLVGDFPNFIENGGPQRDMREFLLNEDAKTSAAGHLYRAIPMRHGTPTSGGASGAPMGSAYSGHQAITDAKQLGKDIYKKAKKLAATTSNPYGGTSYGGRLNIPEVPKLKEHHKTNIYQGIIRQEKTYKKATQSSYTTFRTISDNPATFAGGLSWIRPPRAGVHLAAKVSNYVAKLAPMAFTEYVKSLGGG